MGCLGDKHLTFINRMLFFAVKRLAFVRGIFCSKTFAFRGRLFSPVIRLAFT